MNKFRRKVLPLVTPHTIKLDHAYTVEEVENMTIEEYTELSFFIDGFYCPVYNNHNDWLCPPGWVFKLKWNYNFHDITLPSGKIICPSEAVIDKIVQRVREEGFKMFEIAPGKDSLVWNHDDGIGCLNDESFVLNVRKGNICWHQPTDIYFHWGIDKLGRSVKGIMEDKWSNEEQCFYKVQLHIMTDAQRKLINLLD